MGAVVERLMAGARDKKKETKAERRDADAKVDEQQEHRQKSLAENKANQANTEKEERFTIRGFKGTAFVLYFNLYHTYEVCPGSHVPFISNSQNPDS